MEKRNTKIQDIFVRKNSLKLLPEDDDEAYCGNSIASTRHRPESNKSSKYGGDACVLFQ